MCFSDFGQTNIGTVTTHPVSNSGTMVICSCRSNAVGIALSLRDIGWQGRIICLNTNRGERAVAERWPALCECWSVAIRDPEELPAWLAARLPGHSVAAIFFCDERFLAAFAQVQIAAMFPKARIWVCRSDELEIILDRWKFYAFLNANDLAVTPRTIRETCNPFQEFGGPFRVRVWRSWVGMRKLLRGRTIRTDEELRTWADLCAREILMREEWGYQELLSTDPKHTVSVCGWHDNTTPLYLVTRWVRQTGENGWLVECCPDPQDLQGTAKHILMALRYRGPFEIEFMKDAHGDAYKVIEMNPRFWLQHRLVGKELIRRYLGLEPQMGMTGHEQHYWLDTDVVLRNLLLLRNLEVMGCWFGGTWAVPMRGSFRPAVRGMASSAKRKMVQSIRAVWGRQWFLHSKS